MFTARARQGQRQFLSVVMNFILQLAALWKQDSSWPTADNHVFLSSPKNIKPPASHSCSAELPFLQDLA